MRIPWSAVARAVKELERWHAVYDEMVASGRDPDDAAKVADCTGPLNKLQPYYAALWYQPRPDTSGFLRYEP